MTATAKARADVVPVAEATVRTMRANHGRDSGPELRLRRLLHASSLRFRVEHPLPFDPRRRADVVFTRAGLYVFLDGCFWHGCPDHYVAPRTRGEFWQAKVDANIRRDLDSTARLQALGLSVIRVWEHEDPAEAVERIADTYRELLGR